LMSLEQMPGRMPALRQRGQALRAELQAIADKANDRAAFLRLAETLTAFRARMHGAAHTLSIIERQRIVRLVVKDVLIGDDTITIRHSIPVQQGPPQGGCLPPSQTDGPIYLLCKGSEHPTSRNALFARCRQHQLQQTHHLVVIDPARNFFKQQMMSDCIEVCSQIQIYHAGLALNDCRCYSMHRLMCGAFGTIAIRSWLEIRLENRLQYELERALHHSVTDSGDRQDANFSSVLRYLPPPCS